MVDILESSLVRIYNLHHWVVGAAFLVDERRVLTCAHVVKDALGLTLIPPQPPEGEIELDFPLLRPVESCRARVVCWDAAQDIAGLELSGPPPAAARPAGLVSGDDLWEHRFRCCGFPQGHDMGTWVPGELLGRNAEGQVQMKNKDELGYCIAPGFSGAPVWDEALGGVAGMLAAVDRQYEKNRVAFLIPADALGRAWSDLAVRIGLPASSPEPDPPNPFHAGGRINDPAQFFGRQRLVREMRDLLAGFQSVSLVGENEIGKSSLLYYLYATRQEWLPGVDFVFLDLQGIWDEGDFWAEVLEALGENGDTPRQLRRALHSRRAILLLDEVEQIAGREFSPKLHGLLRALGQEPGIALCTATRRPLPAVFPPDSGSLQTSPFHNIFTVKSLGPFSLEEARRFIAGRLRGSRVQFSPAQVEQLLQRSQGHPARLQRLAWELFEGCR